MPGSPTRPAQMRGPEGAGIPLTHDTVLDREAPMAGLMARQERRFAYGMLVPTFVIVLSIVLLPVMMTFWISFKPITLPDLRTAAPRVSERVRDSSDIPGANARIEYQVRNSSATQIISDVVLEDVLLPDLQIVEVEAPCTVDGGTVTCAFGNLEGGQRLSAAVHFNAATDLEDALEDSEPVVFGTARNPLTSFSFSLDNFVKILTKRDFWTIAWTTVAYSFGATVGSVVLGLFAALLLNQQFRGQAVLRGLFLFPYVAPVIAVAFTWLYLLDPFSGSINALATEFGVIDEPINFMGVRSVPVTVFGLEFEFPVALTTVIAFSSWSYFPLAFLFILARIQSMPTDLYDAAKVDGATPFQMFWHITLPQLMGILLLMSMLRFIWTFNKFEDIFLLTGGGAGTRTLTVDVYQEGFAIGDIGAGAAVSVIIFALLLVFVAFYMRALAKQGEL